MAGTSFRANPTMRVTSQTASLAAGRVRSMTVEYREATVLTTLTTGFVPRRKILPISAVGVCVADVDNRPTPATRSAKKAGSAPARPRTAMPPIECPINTTGPTGAAVAMTAARSWASIEIGGCGSLPRLDRPCERWS